MQSTAVANPCFGIEGAMRASSSAGPWEPVNKTDESGTTLPVANPLSPLNPLVSPTDIARPTSPIPGLLGLSEGVVVERASAPPSGLDEAEGVTGAVPEDDEDDDDDDYDDAIVGRKRGGHNRSSGKSKAPTQEDSDDDGDGDGGDDEDYSGSAKLLEGVSLPQQELIRQRTAEFHTRDMSAARTVYAKGDKTHLNPANRGPNDSCLTFSSEFECGNLEKGVQISRFEYDLELSVDQTMGGKITCQWFYFSVLHIPAGVYTFNLLGFYKSASLYNLGLRPYLYSKKAKCWKSIGEQICYFKHRTLRRNDQDTFVLSFRWTHQDPKDIVFFAYCFPFTYSDLQYYLQTLEDAAAKQNFFALKRKVLCETTQKRKCELITIKKNLTGEEKANRRVRKYIVFTCRVHPGESNSSWILKGILDFLTSNKTLSRNILNTHSIVCVPMLNPDGVALGHYRCDSNGVDLNRVWKNPQADLHPTVYHTKQLIKRLQSKGQISYFFDLHGHSRKQKLFAYGCSNTKSMKISALHRYPHEEKILPYILGKLYPEFSFDASQFAVSKKKEGTARVVSWLEYGIALSYTIEASFAGTSNSPNEYVSLSNFDLMQYQEMGMYICKTLNECTDPKQTTVVSAVRDLMQMHCSGLLSRLSGDGRPSTRDSNRSSMPSTPLANPAMDLNGPTSTPASSSRTSSFQSSTATRLSQRYDTISTLTNAEPKPPVLREPHPQSHLMAPFTSSATWWNAFWKSLAASKEPPNSSLVRPMSAKQQQGSTTSSSSHQPNASNNTASASSSVSPPRVQAHRSLMSCLTITSLSSSSISGPQNGPTSGSGNPEVSAAAITTEESGSEESASVSPGPPSELPDPATPPSISSRLCPISPRTMVTVAAGAALGAAVSSVVLKNVSIVHIPSAVVGSGAGGSLRPSCYSTSSMTDSASRRRPRPIVTTSAVSAATEDVPGPSFEEDFVVEADDDEELSNPTDTNSSEGTNECAPTPNPNPSNTDSGPLFPTRPVPPSAEARKTARDSWSLDQLMSLADPGSSGSSWSCVLSLDSLGGPSSRPSSQGSSAQDMSNPTTPAYRRHHQLMAIGAMELVKSHGNSKYNVSRLDPVRVSTAVAARSACSDTVSPVDSVSSKTNNPLGVEAKTTDCSIQQNSLPQQEPSSSSNIAPSVFPLRPGSSSRSPSKTKLTAVSPTFELPPSEALIRSRQLTEKLRRHHAQLYARRATLGIPPKSHFSSSGIVPPTTPQPTRHAQRSNSLVSASNERLLLNSSLDSSSHRPASAMRITNTVNSNSLLHQHRALSVPLATLAVGGGGSGAGSCASSEVGGPTSNSVAGMATMEREWRAKWNTSPKRYRPGLVKRAIDSRGGGGSDTGGALATTLSPAGPSAGACEEDEEDPTAFTHARIGALRQVFPRTFASSPEQAFPWAAGGATPTMTPPTRASTAAMPS